MRPLVIALAAALLAPAAAASARPDGSVREVARLLAAAPGDDLAEDALYRQIQSWTWPAPKAVRLSGRQVPGRRVRHRAHGGVSPSTHGTAPTWAYGNLDGRSRALLHLGDLGARFPLDPDDASLSDAARRVGRYAPLKALRSLRLALRSPDAGVRAQAALALGWARDPGAEPFVVGLLGDREASVRARAAEALGVMDDRAAIPKLQAALDDSSPTVRIFAARALGHLGDARSLERLRDLSLAGEPPLRRAAWDAIARLGGRGSVSVLRDALGDPGVRYGRLADNVSRAALPAELRDLAEKGADEEAIRLLARSAGWGADAQGLALLAADLADPDPVLRRAAVVALGAARNPLSTDALLRALRDHDGQVRGLAAQGLALIGNPRSVEALTAALKRGDARVAGIDQAGPAIVALADPRSLPALLALVRGPDPVVAAAALVVIGRLGDVEEVPAVAWALWHKDHRVRSSAARAVADLAEVGAARNRFVACGDWGKKGALLTDADVGAGVSVGIRPGGTRASGGNLAGSGQGQAGCALRTLAYRARDPVPGVRMAAVVALGRLGDNRAYGALYEAGRDRDSGVSDAARVALGAIGVGYAAEPLGKAVRSGSAAAASGLAALGPDAAAVRIAGLLAASDPATRGQAAGALREFWAFGTGGQDGGADTAAAARLARALRDPDRGVRIQAALALAEFPGSAPAAALRNAVARSNPFARTWFAAAAVHQSGGGRTAGNMVAWAALQEAATNPDPELRRAAMQATAWMRLPDGGSQAGSLLRDRDPAVRDAAALALARSPGFASRELLLDLVSSGDWRQAVTALDAMDGRDFRVGDLVEGATEHRDIRVRWAAERLVMRAERFDIQVDRTAPVH